MEYSITLGAVDPTVKVVTLDQAKFNSNIEHVDTDAFLQLLLDAAIVEAENYTERSIQKRGVTIHFSAFSKKMVIPYNPIISITSITYMDVDGLEQTVDSGVYKVVSYDNGLTQKLYFSWDSAPELDADEDFPITVTAVAGYADAPADIKQAILLIFSHNEMFREDAPIKLDRSSRAKLRPYRKY